MSQNDGNGGNGGNGENEARLPQNSIARIYGECSQVMRGCIGTIRKECDVRNAIQCGCFIVFILSFVIGLSITAQKDDIDREYDRFKQISYNVTRIAYDPVCFEESYRSACLFKTNLRPPCVDYIVTLEEFERLGNFANFSASCNSRGGCRECTRDWLEIFSIGEIVTMYRDSENHNNVQFEPPPDSYFLNSVLYGLSIACLASFCVICCSHHCCKKKTRRIVQNRAQNRAQNRTQNRTQNRAQNQRQSDRQRQIDNDMLNADLDALDC